MESDKYELAIKYFQLEFSIEESQQRINDIRKGFYSNSMHTRTETSLEGRMITHAFKQELEVSRLVDCISYIEKHIEMNQKKKRYLNDYVHTLPLEEQNYLFERYCISLGIPLRDSVETALKAEIIEIEEAIQFMYGYEPEVKEYFLNGDSKSDFNIVLEALGVN